MESQTNRKPVSNWGASWCEPAASILFSPNPVQQPSGTLTEVPLQAPPLGAAPGEARGQKCCRAAIHHHHHPPPFITPALSTFIQFIRPVFRGADLRRADRKARLTAVTLELASVCGGGVVTAPLAGNQLLPGYRLSAPPPLSYYYNAAAPAQYGPSRPVPPPPHCSHPALPQPDPLSPHGVWRRSSTAGVSSSCRSSSSLRNRSLGSLVFVAPLPLTHRPLDTRQPTLFSFRVEAFGGSLSLCRPPKLEP